MIKKKVTVIIISGLSAIILLAACAAQKAIWGNEKTGFILTYRPSPGDAWIYQANGEEKTVINIMGNDHETTATTKNNYTVSAQPGNDANLHFSVTIDDFARDIKSPEGEYSIDASPIVGKAFDLILSPLGKEIEYKGIEELQVDFGEQGGGKQNVLNLYRDILPDLADKPVKVGDSWTVLNEFTGPAGNMEITVNTEAVHKIEGLELVGGKECLRISANYTGTLTGQGEQGGNDLDLSGDITGSGTWYFAYKEGVFVKSDGLSSVNGTVKMTGGFELSMPMTQESKASVQLVQN